MPNEKKTKNKIFVLDTNVLIHNPQALFSFRGGRVVIPIVVIEEIDNFKKMMDEKGRNARQIGRYLDEFRSKGSLQEGVEVGHNSIVQVSIDHDIREMEEKYHFSDKNDNLIIGTALHFQEANPKHEVILVSKDANVRIKCDAVGIKAENYENDMINFDELYTGVMDLIVTQAEYNQFEEKHFLTHANTQFYPNQFVRIKTKTSIEVLLGRYSAENKTIYPLSSYKGQPVFSITDRNDEQKFALDLLLDESIRLVSLIGKAGTGKTLLALAAGLHQVVESARYKRLVVSRPIFPLGKDLGFLPGTKSEKFNPWMQPIYDNMEILISGHHEHEETKNGKHFGKKTPSIQDYLDFDYIELEPLTYIRGRSLPNQYIIIDEAQNLTPHEMKTIITRAGEGTKIVLTGDPYQIDIPYLDSESNGLSMSAEKLKNENIVGHITLQKGERSELADIAAKYF